MNNQKYKGVFLRGFLMPDIPGAKHHPFLSFTALGLGGITIECFSGVNSDGFSAACIHSAFLDGSEFE